MKVKLLTPAFVNHLPEQLLEGVLYVSDEFAIAAHKCCCGCGEDVITPLKSAHWKLTRSQGAVSLNPSIGNWKFSCRSHYWIRNNQVVDAPPMHERSIELVKQRDRRDKDRYIQQINKSSSNAPSQAGKQFSHKPNEAKPSIIAGAFKRFKEWLRG